MVHVAGLRCIGTRGSSLWVSVSLKVGSDISTDIWDWEVAAIIPFIEYICCMSYGHALICVVFQ